jgi:hypothetical protein
MRKRAQGQDFIMELIGRAGLPWKNESPLIEDTQKKVTHIRDFVASDHFIKSVKRTVIN